MTYTPSSGIQPGKSRDGISETDTLRRREVNVKESHIHRFRHGEGSQKRAQAQAPALHSFDIAVLMDDGKVSRFDHRAPLDLYLEDICACFGRGTLIATPNGQVAVEDLQPGDQIKTGNGKAETLRWISSCTLPIRRNTPETEMAIRIKADALGELRPLQDLMVSPRFRLLTNHPSCEALFGSPETLAPAIDLLDGDMILQMRPSEGLEFFNLMFDSHQLIEANGLTTESYHPGNFGVAVMTLEMQSHLRQIFPHLSGDLNSFGRTIRPILKGFEAEVLRVN